MAGLIYILVAIGIFLDHFLRFEAMWNWEEALHHETFFIATIWVGAAYLTVATVEYTIRRRKTKSQSKNG
jgi:hypothetical protein